MVSNTWAVEGTFYTNGFPLQYPNNRKCKQVVYALPSAKITVTVGHFDMEYMEDCLFDSISVCIENFYKSML